MPKLVSFWLHPWFATLYRYLVDARWFKQLKKYLGIDHDISALGESNNATNHPGPIDNGPLFAEDAEQPGEIRDGLIDELEYILLPEDCWKVLADEFKLTEGQEPIARKVNKITHDTIKENV